MPARYGFRHLYFSPDHRGANAREDSARALAKLLGQPEDTKLAQTMADRFMFQDYYRDRAAEFLGKEFGPKFAEAIARLAPGSWQGPVESGYGVHLVLVSDHTEGRLPALADVRDAVRREWQNSKRLEANDKFYRQLLKHYTVTIEGLEPKVEQQPKLAEYKAK
jgi:hypothetical protein